MNILGFNLHISRSNPAETSDTPAPQQKHFTPEEWLRGDDLGHTSLTNAYEQVVWVYRAINVLAEQVANIPFLFSVGERGRENLVTSGPLIDFYARPHPQLNRFQYWELRVIWLMLRGECFRIPVFENPGGALSRPRLKKVLLLDPANFQHIVEDHQLIGWRYTGYGPGTPLESQVFLPEEVWHERLPNPFNFWRGLPPLSIAAMAAGTDFAAASFMRGIIENNADTGVIVRTEKWLSPEQRTEILAAIQNRKRRAGVADRPVLVAGATEIIKPTLSSTDLQFLENRKFSRGEICAAFGVPEEIVTTTDHAKYDVMAGARLNFIENRVAPLCARLEAEEAVTVQSIDPRAGGWFDLDSLPIMQEARRSRLAAARSGFEMGLPFNELNRVLDLGFRPLPWGNRGFVPRTLRDLGEDQGADGKSRGPQPTAPTPGTALPSPADPFTRALDLLSERTADPQTAADPRFAGKLRRFLFEQRQRVLAALATAEPSALSPAALLHPDAELHQLLVLLNTSAQQHEPGAAARGIPEEVCAWCGKLVAACQAELTAGIAAGESGGPLAARVKAFYNQVSKESFQA